MFGSVNKIVSSNRFIFRTYGEKLPKLIYKDNERNIKVKPNNVKLDLQD